MNSTDIAFPHLGIYLENVPKSFSVFGISIALYGVIIATGLCLGLLLAAKIAKKSGQNPDIYWDFIIYAAIISIICARIYYVAFSWDYYKNNFWSVFNLRNGGIAIYGAVIGAFGTLFVYAKIKKLNPLLMADTAVPGLVLGQLIGRWGNFTNREAFGEYTDSLLAMRLPIAAVRSSDITENIAAHIEEGANYIQVHPTFLYESLWNVLVLIIMLLWWKHRKFNGEIALIYFGGYGLGRAWIEGLRTDQLLIPHTSLAVSQLLACALVVMSVTLETIKLLKIKKEKNIVPEQK